MMKELSLYLSEPSKGYADPIKAEIKRDGSFNITFPVMGTQRPLSIFLVQI